MSWLAADGALAAANQSGDDSPVIVRAASVEGDVERTRFRLEVGAIPDVNVFALADPYRIIIDLANARFALSRDAGRTPHGLVKGFRFGEVAPGKSRIVIDLARPASVDRFFNVPSRDAGPGEFAVDLVPIDEGTFRAALKTGVLTGLGRDPEAAETVIDVPDGARPVIVLDPGHGGIDPGAEGTSGLEEKLITLVFARELRDGLEKTGEFDVRLTRSDDRFVALGERVELARAFGADLFISIHADTAPQSHVRGASVYTLSERASDAASAELAIRQNLVDSLSGFDTAEPSSEVTNILVQLARRETRNFSTYFADVLVDALVTSVRTLGNPHRSARFWVLRAHDIPSVLLEIGYLSNEKDARLLEDPAWRARAVDAVVAATRVFFSQRLAGTSMRKD